VNSLFAQSVDFDDLYFNSTDRKILEGNAVERHETPVKKQSYLPSNHKSYNYYGEIEVIDTVMHIERLSLNYFFLIPMSVSNWTLFKLKNIHLIYPDLVTAYNYKYHSNIIEFPFPYVNGVRSRYIINWGSPKVNFWLMK